mgnify:CR=1 FL=1
MAIKISSKLVHESISTVASCAGDGLLGLRGVSHIGLKYEGKKLFLETFNTVSGCSLAIEDKNISEKTNTTFYPIAEMRELFRRMEGTILMDIDEDGSLHLKGSGSRYTLKSIVPQTHTTFPFEEKSSDEVFEMKNEEFINLLEKVLIVARHGGSQGYSSGTLLDFRGHELRIVNTDGFRMAISRKEDHSGIERKIQVDTDALKNILKSLSGKTGTLEGKIRDDHIMFVHEGVKLFATTLTPTYPDYEKILEREHTKKIILDKSELTKALERLQQFGKYQELNNAALIKIENGEVLITTDETPRGQGEEVLFFEEGEGVVFLVCLNSAFMLDFLKTVKGNKIQINFEDPHSSCLFCDPEDEGYKYFLMTLKHPKIEAT